MKQLLTLTLVLAGVACALAQGGPRRKTPETAPSALPAGYWSREQSKALLDRVQTVRLSPDLSHLTEGERLAVAKLLEVGRIFQELYEGQRHPEALLAAQRLRRLHEQRGDPTPTDNLLTIYRLFQGPIATTLDNRREPFLPVEVNWPGKNVYPWRMTKGEMEEFLAAHPEKRAALLDPRTVVKRADAQSLRNTIYWLKRDPLMTTLHPRLLPELEELLKRPDPRTLYAVPYAVAYAGTMMDASKLLNEAADAVEKDDWEFARYLRNRARDLLTNDYESGDASWVKGHFKNLNAQIGAYEVYDDELYGVKTFYSLSLLATRREETDTLRRALGGLQALENSLPHARHKKVQDDIPVGVYEVIADFGQARGGNTATILPNENYLARRYGRIILMRANIMRNPVLFDNTGQAWEAAVAPAHKDELTSDGGFYRTLWHEVGHYLGVDATKTGQTLDTALQENAGSLEEMKADLVSLFVAEALRKQGYYTAAQLRSVYASGVNRVLVNNRPRREQTYETMQLMQWNYFLEHGLLSFDAAAGKLRINYDKYHDVVGKLLEKVLEVQSEGDKAASDRFIEQYTKWDENLHGVVAKSIRDRQRYRFRLFKYAALGE